MSKEAFGVGGGSTDTLGNIIALSALPSAGDNYMTLETPTGTDYPVPGGKTLIITLVQIAPTGANAGVVVGHGSGFVADGAAAPTDAKAMTKTIRSLAADVTVAFPVHILIPTGRYPFVQAIGAGCIANIFGIVK